MWLPLHNWNKNWYTLSTFLVLGLPAFQAHCQKKKITQKERYKKTSRIQFLLAWGSWSQAVSPNNSFFLRAYVPFLISRGGGYFLCPEAGQGLWSALTMEYVTSNIKGLSYPDLKVLPVFTLCLLELSQRSVRSPSHIWRPSG